MKVNKQVYSYIYSIHFLDKKKNKVSKLFSGFTYTEKELRKLKN